MKALAAMLVLAAVMGGASGLISCASRNVVQEPARPALETAPVSETNMTTDAYRSKIVDWQNRSLQLPATPKWLAALAQGDDQVVKDMFAGSFTDLGSDAVIKLIIVQNPNLATAQAQALTGTAGLVVKLATEMRTTMSMEAGSSLTDDQQSTAMTAAAKARFDVSGLRQITDWWQQVETYNAEGRRTTQYLYYAVYATGRAQWQTLTRAYLNQVLNELMKDNSNRSAATQIARQFDQITEASAKTEAWNKDEIAYQRQLAQEARQDANTARDQQYQRDMQADRLAAANARTAAQTQQAQIQAVASTEQTAIAPERQKAIAASVSGGDIDWVAALSTAADVIL
jgi:hypothetical protein